MGDQRFTPVRNVYLIDQRLHEHLKDIPLEEALRVVQHALVQAAEDATQQQAALPAAGGVAPVVIHHCGRAVKEQEISLVVWTAGWRPTKLIAVSLAQVTTLLLATK